MSLHIGYSSGNVILYDLYQHKLNEFVNGNNTKGNQMDRFYLD